MGAELQARDFDASLHRKKGPAAGSPRFIDLAHEFLVAKQQVLAQTTIARFLVRMKGTILPDLGSCLAVEITPQKLERYSADRTKDGVKRTTIHREIADIRAVLRWAAKRRLIASNPMAGYEMPTRDDARLSPPSEAEFRAILECAVPHLQRAMLISWHTGLRPGIEELLTLRWDAVDMAGKTLMVISAVKGGLPRRMVPLNKHILEYLA
jgi:site-specific recombinase XerD